MLNKKNLLEFLCSEYGGIGILGRRRGRHYIGNGGNGGGVPSNGYVAEDGVTSYVAEDGTTYYVQES